MRSQKPVLLSEDNEIDVMSMQRAFKDLRITNQLIVTTNGQEALDYLRDPKNTIPCILLLDIHMPKMNGLHLLKILKSDPLLKLIPVIMLTSSDEEKDRNAAFAESIAGYILKPVDYTKLVEVIKSIDLYWTISELPEI